MDGIAAVRHLTIRYAGQDRAAIDDMSMSIAGQMHCAVLGPSGAGKSTLLHALSGILAGQNHVTVQGSILMEGMEIVGSTHDSAFPRVALMPQDPSVVFSDLVPTVEDEVKLTLQQTEISRDEWGARIDDSLKACGIAHLADRSPHSLSGGEQQLSALAILLAAHPPLLCMDEPCVSLDQERQLEVSRLLYRTLRHSAVVLSDSTMSLPALLCDQIVVLDGGHTIFSGTREEFWDNLDRFTSIVDLGSWLETRNAVGPLARAEFERLLEGIL